MDERDQRVGELLDHGVPKAQIARWLGIDRSTVSRIAARLGQPAKRRVPDEFDWDGIRGFYEAGHSAAECQRRFGIKPTSWDAAIYRGEITPRERTSQRPPGERRRQVEELLNDGRSLAEIAERLGVSKPTVCYHARKLGVPAQQRFARRYDWTEVQRTYDTGMAMRECKRIFGFTSDAWSAAVARGDVVPRSNLIPLDALLVVGRGTSRGHLKARLIKAGLKENRCEECGLTEWRGRPFNMQLHHINGDGADNRLENLSLLCANCHAQTDTWGGRNTPRRRGHLQLVEADPEPGTPPDDAAGGAGKAV